MSTKKEQIRSYTRTWVKNRYTKFFESIMLGIEPQEVNPSSIVDILIRMRYKLTQADYYIMKQAIHEGKGTYKQKVLHFTLEDAKQEAIVYSKNLIVNVENIFSYHEILHTPFQGIIFHIYCFLKFGIKSKSVEHNFPQLLNYMLTGNQEIIESITEQHDDYKKSTRKNPKFNSNKSKEKWLDRAAIYGHKIEKRKIVLFKDMPKK